MKNLFLILFTLMISCSINQEKDLENSLKITDKYYTYIKSNSYNETLTLFGDKAFINTPKETILKTLNTFNLKFGNYKEHKLTNHAPTYHGNKLINMKLEFEVSYERIKTIEQFSLSLNEKDKFEILSYNLMTIDSTKVSM
jgi:hypothetical protein